jgi:hypothetical protein
MLLKRNIDNKYMKILNITGHQINENDNYHVIPSHPSIPSPQIKKETITRTKRKPTESFQLFIGKKD